MYWRLLLMVLFVGSCFASEGPKWGKKSDELAITAEGELRPGTNDSGIVLTLHLTNTSKREITVLTKNPDVATDGHSIVMNFLVAFNETTWDRITRQRIIPPLSDLAPVTLKPGETTRVVATYPYNSQIPPNTRLSVVYRIAPEVAKRYGTWTGWVETKPFPAKVTKDD